MKVFLLLLFFAASVQAGGVIDPQTGEFYLKSDRDVHNPKTSDHYQKFGDKGYIDTKNGDYYQKSGQGNINTKTGEYKEDPGKVFDFNRNRDDRW